MVGAAEPKLYPGNEAKAYGVVKDAPRLANGSVTVKTTFHVVSDHALSSKETTRYETLISNQMTVLNDSYAARTAADAADTPFRFALATTTYTVDQAWSTVPAGRGGAGHEGRAL